MKTLLTFFVGSCLAISIGHAQVSAVKKIYPSTAISGASFGSSVATSAKWVAIGAPGETSGAGAVYIFSTSSGAFVRKTDGSC